MNDSEQRRAHPKSARAPRRGRADGLSHGWAAGQPLSGCTTTIRANSTSPRASVTRSSRRKQDPAAAAAVAGGSARAALMTPSVLAHPQRGWIEGLGTLPACLSMPSDSGPKMKTPKEDPPKQATIQTLTRTQAISYVSLGAHDRQPHRAGAASARSVLVGRTRWSIGVPSDAKDDGQASSNGLARERDRRGSRHARARVARVRGRVRNSPDYPGEASDALSTL